MSSTNGGSRRGWLALLPLLAVLAALLLAACGPQGNPPALGKAVQVTLRANSGNDPLGQAILTPAYGAHVVVYMHGSLLPYANPDTPAELRQGGCYGPVVAPLTANAPTDGAQAFAQPDSKAGVNVAHAVDTNWYVVVLKSAAPGALVAYCGHPLSTRRQYFDLYLPDRVDNGIGYGIALIEGIVVTRVNVSLVAPTAKQPAQWSIHSGGCQGGTLASGTIATGSATGSGMAFAPLDAQTWWLSLAMNGSSGQAACVRAG